MEQEEIIERNEIIFKDTEKDSYVLSVDEDNNPLTYTDSSVQALGMPNTINFKNSRKYKSLASKDNIVLFTRIKKSVTWYEVEEL